MRIIDFLGTWFIRKRIHQIEYFKKNPEEVQQNVLRYLLQNAQNTEYGKKHGFRKIKTLTQFQNQVPVVSYQEIQPYIDRLMKGEQNILWPSPVKWFAKSSGTTSHKSKYIPVSQEALRSCHFAGGKDMLALYTQNYPDTKIFSGKNLSIGGSQENNFSDKASQIFIGNISAIVMKNLPLWAQYSRTPGIDLTLMGNWEEKIKKIATVTKNQKVASMAGNPMWLLLLLQYMLKENNVKYIQDIWPDLEVFFHGAVSLTPYKAVLEKMDRDHSLRFMDIYNATEGFFGLQDQTEDTAMLLMLNYGIFYEFIPAEDFESETPKAIPLWDTETGKNYSVVISTSSGLWRYKIGDTVKFTSLKPYRFHISGRTKNCINVFGEDLFTEHAEKALDAACKKTGAMLDNYTAAPKYYGNGQKGNHEWIVEFTEAPQDLELFTQLLDQELCSVNEDYAEKRKFNIAIEKPVVHEVPQGTFYAWLKNKGKLGGQHKIPRLSNSREMAEDLLKISREIQKTGTARI